ncbi:MAG: DUF1824 family protein [Prochlorotrichaceae cyanobacterium]
MSIAIEPALTLLRDFSCLTPRIVASDEEKQALRQAISQVVQLSEWQNIGICADTIPQALQALVAYLTGLGANCIPEMPTDISVSTAIYLKYNSQKQSYYIDSYKGEYRGVLLSCQGSEEVVGTYGYFPLDLFDTAA